MNKHNNGKTLAALAAVMLAGFAVPMATAHPDDLNGCADVTNLTTSAPAGGSWPQSLTDTETEDKFDTSVPDGQSKDLRISASASGLKYEVFRLVAGVCTLINTGIIEKGDVDDPASDPVVVTLENSDLGSNEVADEMFFVHIYRINPLDSAGYGYRIWRDG